jgi:hypothetical protein
MLVTLAKHASAAHSREIDANVADFLSIAVDKIADISNALCSGGSQGLRPVPDEPIKRVPVPFGVINVWVYGMLEWG